MLKLLFICLAVIGGLVFGFYFPCIANYLITKKCKQKKRQPPAELEFSAVARVAVPVIFALSFGFLFYFVAPIEALFICCFIAVAIVATWIDHKIRIIPNEINLILVILGLVYRFLVHGVNGLLEAAEACALVAAVFLVLKILFGKNSRFSGGIGAGDVKLLLATAIAVGYPGVLVSMMVMAVAVAVYCLGGLLLKKLTLASYFPMCGFIMIGLLSGIFAAM